MTENNEPTPKAGSGLVEATKKAAYAAVGAPVVATRRLGRLSDKWRMDARREFEKWVSEGERMTAELRQGKVVDEIKEKVDFDHLQGRVERLRDQLEDVLANWRATFKPEKADAAATAVTDSATAAKKTAAPAKKATATAKTGAADKADA
jgi:topoisomerase IA-like protein